MVIAKAGLRFSVGALARGGIKYHLLIENLISK